MDDLDGGGGRDIVGVLDRRDDIALYENESGSGDRVEKRVIVPMITLSATRITLADLDGSGETNLAWIDDSGLWWHANTHGTYGAPGLVAASNLDPLSLDSGDVDGDADLLTAGKQSSDDFRNPGDSPDCFSLFQVNRGIRPLSCPRDDQVSTMGSSGDHPERRKHEDPELCQEKPMKNSRTWNRPWVGLVVLAAVYGSVLAGDGVREINQSCASAPDGCFAGDSQGFPVTIGSPGSYRLTGDLVLGSPATSGIEITSSNVTLDLNGFSIVGPVTCTGFPVTACDPGGSGRGIHADATRSSVAVFGGTVRGIGDYGVMLLGHTCRVSNLRAIENGSVGIMVGSEAIVLNSQAIRNEIYGFLTAEFTDHGVLLSGNTASGNGNDGFKVRGSGNRITGNIARLNGQDGIDALGFGNSVTHNTVWDNDSFGLVLDIGTGYSDNVIYQNAGGTVSGGVEMGSNVCEGDTTCP